MSDPVSERVLERARAGDAEAQAAVVTALRDDVYGLSVRILGHPDDAEDAAQEILMRILDKLPTFRGDSSLRTWSYRVAVNFLLNVRKSRVEATRPSFEGSAAQLDAGLAAAAAMPPSTDAILIRELKVYCTQGMLMCLDRDHRLAYVLGEILELPGQQAAEMLDVAHATFRKRLSRARQQLTEFMQARCGLVDPARDCRCAKLVPLLVEQAAIDPDNPMFSSLPTYGESVELDERIDNLRTAAQVFRSHPRYAAPQRLVRRLKEALDESGL